MTLLSVEPSEGLISPRVSFAAGGTHAPPIMHVPGSIPAVYSPRLTQNIALAMVSCDCAEIGTSLEVVMPTGSVQATVVEKPFYDPKRYCSEFCVISLDYCIRR